MGDLAVPPAQPERPYRGGRAGRSTGAALTILALLIAPGLLGLPAAGDRLTTFSTGAATARLDYAGPGNGTVSIILPNDADVSRAGLDVQGLEITAGQGYPSDVALDVGGDGTTDWAFAGLGVGSPGHQTLLSNGAGSGTVTFAAKAGGTDSSLQVLLPKYAKLQSVSLQLAGNGSTHFPRDGPVLKGGVPGGQFGNRAVPVGDVNTDSHDDLLVTSAAGERAALFFGGPSFDANPDRIIVGAAGSSFGQSAAGLNDFNNDGYNDFAIGQNLSVLVYFGGPGLDIIADMVLTGEPATNSYFGFALAGGSDLNGDGFPDIAVGDLYNDMGGSTRGKVYVFNGGPAADTAWDTKLQGSPFDTFGDAVATGGDINNDGYDDLVVGAPAIFGFLKAAVWVYAGGPAFGGAPLVIINSPIMDDIFGYGIALSGDVTGDSIDDLLVGGPFNGTGKVYLYQGRSVWPVNPAADGSLAGEVSGDAFGASIAILNDPSGDGKDEVVIGAPVHAGPAGTGSGRSYFINGSFPLTRAQAITYDGKSVWAEEGWWVDRAGDLNGDGDRDFVTAAVGNSSGIGAVGIHFAAYGALSPGIRLGGVTAPLGPGPLLNGSAIATPSAIALQTTVATTPATYTDSYGNPFLSLPIDLSAGGPAVLTVSQVVIEYVADTSSGMNLAPALNAALTAARSVAPAGQDTTVPIVLSTGSRGRLDLSGVDVQYTLNLPPVAFIDSVEPPALEEGQPVTLTGHGTDDGTVVTGRWTSDRDGLVGTGLTAKVASLTEGVHTITFEVQDDRGRWSLPVTTMLLVDPLNLAPSVTLDRPADRATVWGTVVLAGNATDANPEDTLTVEIRIDQGVWQPVEGVAPWSFAWDASIESDGEHQVEVRAGDGRRTSPVVGVSLNVTHPVPGIAVTAPAGVTAHPGDSVTLSFTVANPGTAAADFLLAGTAPGGTVTVTPRTVRLEPGASAAVTVAVAIPHTMVTPSAITVSLTAAAVGEASLSATGRSTISVEPKPPDPLLQGVRVDSTPGANVRPGKSIVYSVRVQNVGTAKDSYTLSAVSSAGWTVSLHLQGGGTVPTPLVIPAGAVVELELTVSVPTGAKPGTTDRTTVIAKSVLFPPLSDDAVSSTRVLPPITVRPGIPGLFWLAAGGILVLGTVLAGTVAGTEWGRYRFFWLLLPLYSRLRQEEVLDNFSRGEINAFIRLNPGTYYNEIKRHLAISNGVLTYHLNRLEHEGYVRSKNSGRFKHFFPSDMPIPAVIVKLNEFQRGLLRLLRDNTGATQQQIADQLDVPLPTVSRHLRKLVDGGFITVQRWDNLFHYQVSPSALLTLTPPPPGESFGNPAQMPGGAPPPW